MVNLSSFVRDRRKSLGMTQPDLAGKAGTGLRFIRELEQGKKTLRMDKVNQVLMLFGFELGPIIQKREQITNEKS
ncbi:MAG: helix-turn-helix transcriptional regulator [Chlorobium sp.]